MAKQQSVNKKQTKKPFLKRKIGMFLLMIGVLIVAGIVYLASRTNYHEYPSDLVEKARSFKVPEGWKEVKFHVEDRKKGCIGVVCPSVILVYESTKPPLTDSEFAVFVNSSSSGVKVKDGDCNKSSDDKYYCQSESKIGNLDHYISSSGTGNKSRIYISIRELNRE